MEIQFATTKLCKECSDFKSASKKYGPICARLIILRINELQAATSLEDIHQLRRPRLHWLTGNRKHQLTVDVQQPYRLILEPIDAKSREFKDITKVAIIDITDYH